MSKWQRGELLRTALRVFGYQVAFGFFGLMFAPMMMGASVAIRVPLIGALIAACGLLMFMDGSYRGERDCAVTETLEKLTKKGEYTPTGAELAKRYNRSKGVIGALIGALPALALAIYVAVSAVPYTYTLQDLPGWLSTYLPRAEIGDALRYLKDVTVSVTLTDYLRITVRFILFPYIGLLGNLTDAGSLLLDRLSPLLTLIMPAVSAIGYQFGPSRRRKAVKMIEEAKRRPRRRLKKAAKQRIIPEKKQII
ncbi:MAG: hypothetical protein FWG37_00935 [Clostridia bacterium]|nr:hypothetical protein [Clostridia bacterium]